MPENEQGRPGEGSGPDTNWQASHDEDTSTSRDLPEWAASASLLVGRDIPPVETLPFLAKPGYIAQGFSTLVAGYPKIGKTTLLTALCREWGRKKIGVVVLTEESPRMWALRLRTDDEAQWAGVTFGFVMTAGRGSAGRVPTDELLRFAFDGPESVVVLDTLRSTVDLGEETDNAAVARAVRPWIAGAQRSRKTLIALHHTVKDGGAHGRAIAGGHALLGMFDAALEIDRPPGPANRRRVSALSRLLDPEPLLYEQSEGGELIALGGVASVSRSEVAARVRDVLTDLSDHSDTSDQWHTRSAIRDALDEPKPSASSLRNALDDLVSDGDVVFERRGRASEYALARNAISSPDSLQPVQQPVQLPVDKSSQESAEDGTEKMQYPSSKLHGPGPPPDRADTNGEDPAMLTWDDLRALNSPRQ